MYGSGGDDILSARRSWLYHTRAVQQGKHELPNRCSRPALVTLGGVLVGTSHEICSGHIFRTPGPGFRPLVKSW